MQLVQAQASSTQNVFDSNNVSLNRRQTKLIHLMSRYVSLLDLTIISSSITMIGLTIVLVYSPWIIQLMLIIHMQFDVCINLICLYLQFAFANQYYKKYCSWIDNLWLKILMTKAQRSIQLKHQQSLELQTSPENHALKSDDPGNDSDV